MSNKSKDFLIEEVLHLAAVLTDGDAVELARVRYRVSSLIEAGRVAQVDAVARGVAGQCRGAILGGERGEGRLEQWQCGRRRVQLRRSDAQRTEAQQSGFPRVARSIQSG